LKLKEVVATVTLQGTQWTLASFGAVQQQQFTSAMAQTLGVRESDVAIISIMAEEAGGEGARGLGAAAANGNGEHMVDNMDARRVRRRRMLEAAAPVASASPPTDSVEKPPADAIEKDDEPVGLKIEFKVLARNKARAEKMEAAMKAAAEFTAELHDELHAVGLEVPATALAVVALRVDSPGDPAKERTTGGLGDDGEGGLGGTYGNETVEAGGSSVFAILFALMFMGGGGFLAVRHMKKRIAKSKKVSGVDTESSGQACTVTA
jgi:hypothetical protein